MRSNQTHRFFLSSALFFGSGAVFAQDAIVPTQPSTMPSASASSAGNTTRESSPTPGSTAQEMQDKKFLRDFSQGGLAEIKLGQLASTRASSDDVKEFGAKMVADHTQMEKNLSPIAEEMGVRLPKDLNKPDQAQYDKLSKLASEDFDKEYLTMMLDDHRKDLRALRQESIATQDNALKAELDKTFLVVREHMGMVIKLAKEKGIAVPPPPPRPGSAPPAP